VDEDSLERAIASRAIKEPTQESPEGIEGRAWDFSFFCHSEFLGSLFCRGFQAAGYSQVDQRKYK
jgi:hypothetical protein